jgi:hypothetical protein
MSRRTVLAILLVVVLVALAGGSAGRESTRDAVVAFRAGERCSPAARQVAEAIRFDEANGTALSDRLDASRMPEPQSRTQSTGLELGVSSHLIYVSEAEQRAELKRLVAAGVKWVREDFIWSYAEPAPGSFNWGCFDQFMRVASEVGAEVLPIIGYEAAWPGWTDAEYGRYAAAVVSRYPYLKAIELWNEPWLASGGGAGLNQADPARYISLVLAAARKVRAVRPVTILAAGEDVIGHGPRDGQPWLGQIAQALDPHVDAWAIHPYPEPKSRGPLDDDGDTDYRWDYRRVEHSRRHTQKPVWITELGWPTNTHEQSVSEQQQTQYVKEAIALAKTWPYVEKLFIYSWDKSPGDDGFGLRRPDNSTRGAWEEIKR